MTERKPADMGFESWIDKQIREAAERGEFDDLAGAGRPLPGRGEPYDENWWLNQYLRREGGVSGLLPTSLVLRRDLERLPETVAEMTTEAEVRQYVSDLNMRVVEWIRMPHGPHVRLAPAKADEVLAQWRATRYPARNTAPAGEKPSAPKPSGTARRGGPRWWRTLLGRA